MEILNLVFNMSITGSVIFFIFLLLRPITKEHFNSSWHYKMLILILAIFIIPVDDFIKLVNREIRRGNKYDAIIMDPPSYGRGANGEIWKFEENIDELVKLCTQVLSKEPLFFLINSYTTGISSMVLEKDRKSVV